VHVNRHVCRALIDTGSYHTLISKRFAERNKLCISPITCDNPANLFAANGSVLNVVGSTELPLRIQGLSFPIHALVIDSLSDDILLGTTFTNAYSVVLDYGDNVAIFDSLLSLPLINTDSKTRLVRTAKCLYIPPRSEAIIPVIINPKFQRSQILIEPIKGRQFAGFAVARSLNAPSAGSSNVIRILNYNNTPLVLPRFQAVAYITECVANSQVKPFVVNRVSAEVIDSANKSESNSANSSPTQITKTELDEFLATHKFNICETISDDDKYALASLLHEFRDVFAENVTQMKCY